MSVTALFLLSSLGLAITAQAQSCSKPVGGPDMNLKGEDILKDTFPDGYQVTFVCNFGYTSAGGSGSIRCSAGSWSPVRLVCEKKNCGALPDLDHGMIDYPNGTEFGDTAVITCNRGYNLVGKNKIRCGDNGWMDRLPICEVVKCVTPGEIKNGQFSPHKENYDYREVVTYSCTTGLTLNGSSQSFCSENGTFSPAPPTCVDVKCEDPVIPNSEFVDGSRPPHKHLATVTYRCKPGYTMTGQATVTCNINSQWSPKIPECIKSTPPTPPTTTTTTTTKISPVSPTPKDPHGNGHGLKTGLIVGFVVVLIVLIAIGLSYYFGVPAFIWQKKGNRRDKTDKEAAKHDEDLPLS